MAFRIRLGRANLLRSAGAANFNRSEEGIEAGQIAELFTKLPLNSATLRPEKELRATFRGKVVKGSPELNCVMPTGIASFAQLRGIIVDPYEFDVDPLEFIDGRTLESFVRGACTQREFHPEIVTRSCSQARAAVYAELRVLVADGLKKLDDVVAKAAGQATKLWAQTALKWDKTSFHFSRFSTYLRTGTIHHIQGGAGVKILPLEIAALEITPPHFVTSLLATTILQERIAETLEAALVGRSGTMDSFEGMIDGEITFCPN